METEGYFSEVKLNKLLYFLINFRFQENIWRGNIATAKFPRTRLSDFDNTRLLQTETYQKYQHLFRAEAIAFITGNIQFYFLGNT
jgi:hypothetical protein